MLISFFDDLLVHLFLQSCFLKNVKLGVQKTDPVRFKWGFGRGTFERQLAFFEAYKNPIPKRIKCLQNAHFYKQKGHCLQRFPLLKKLCFKIHYQIVVF